MSTFQGPPAPAEFIGWQELGAARFELFNLTRAIEGHPLGSTVSRQTLEELGYTVPLSGAPDPGLVPSSASAGANTGKPAPAERPKIFPNPYLFAD